MALVPNSYRIVSNGLQYKVQILINENTRPFPWLRRVATSIWCDVKDYSKLIDIGPAPFGIGLVSPPLFFETKEQAGEWINNQLDKEMKLHEWKEI